MARVNAKTISDRTLAGAGLSYTEKPGYSFIGYDPTGRKIYSNDKLAQSNDPNMGRAQVGYTSSLLRTLGVANKKDADAMDYIGAVASDASFLNSLYNFKREGKTKEFINTLAQRLKKPIIAEFNDPQNRAGVRAGFQAYNMFTNWDKMSNAQRSMAIAQLGLDTYQFADGTNLRKKQIIAPVIKDGKVVTPGINVGQALSLVGTGVNVVETVRNWNDLSTMGKVTGGARTIGDVINSAKMLGFIQPNGSVKMNGQNVNTGSGQAGAYGAIGTLGNYLVAGAGAVAAGQQLYEAWAKGGSGTEKADATVNAAQAGTAAAAQLGSETAAANLPWITYAVTGYNALRTTFSNDLTNEQKATMIRRTAEDTALNIYTMGAWSLVQGADRAFFGGQTDKLRDKGDKYDLRAQVDNKITEETIRMVTKGQGKNAAQTGRDIVRNQFSASGLTGEGEYTLVLPDGTVADLGIDGRGGRHTVSDVSKATADHQGKKELFSYDVDYTNDMDYIASMGGITMSRMMTGGSGVSIDQVGGQLGNASLGKVGYGAAMTQENFNSVMQNQRAMYAKMGVDSREAMEAILTTMETQGRLTGSQLAAAKQAAVMIFDEEGGYNMARELMAGRWSGIQALDDVKDGIQQDAVKKSEAEAIKASRIGRTAQQAVDAAGGQITPPIQDDVPLETSEEEMQQARELAAQGTQNLQAV